MADRSVLVRLRADTSDFNRKLAGSAAAASAFAKRLDQADGRMANLVQTGLALAPALVPIGGLAVPAVAGLAAQLGFAATAAGVSLLAFQGVGGALEALNKYQLEPTAANFEALQLKMQALGPAGRDFVRTLQDLRPEMQHLQDIAQAGLFPGLTDGIDEALKLLPQAEQLIGTVSETLGGLFREAGDNLNDPRWVKFFEFLDREASPTLEAMGKSFGNVIEGLAAMMQAFDPLADDFTGGMLDMSRSFNQWAQGLDSSQGFRDFLAYIQDNGPEAMETLGAIGNALVQLVKAAAPVGSATLPIIEHLADGFAAIADSPIGPVLIGAAAAIGVLGRSMALLRTVGLMGTAGKTGLLASVFAVDKMRPGVAMVREATSATRGLTVAGKAQAAVAISQEKAVRGAAAQAAKGAGLIAGLALATSGLADDTGAANTATFALMGSLYGLPGIIAGGVVGGFLDTRDAAAKGADAVDDLTAAMDAAGDSGPKMAAAISDAREKLKALRDDTHTDSFGEFFKNAFDPDVLAEFTDRALGTATAEDKLKAGIRDAAQAQADARAGILSGADALGALLSPALGLTRDQFDAATQSATEFRSSLASILGLLDKRGAIRDYEAAIDDLRKSLKENGQTFGTNTDKARANQAALDNIASTALTVAEKLKGMNRVHFLEGARKSFIGAAQDLGFTERQAAKLATRLGLLGKQKPKPEADLDTSLFDGKVHGANRDLNRLAGQRPTPRIDADNGPARQKVSATDRLLAELTGHPYTTSIHADTGQAMGALAALRATYDSFRDKTVTVTINTNATVGEMAANSGRHKAGGGPIMGPGSKTSDSVPVMASRGEFMMSAAAVDHYGLDLMFAMNARHLADGGSTDGHKFARGVRGADREFRLAGSMSTREIRQELHDFAKAIHDAGGVVGKNFTALGKRAVALSDDWDKAHDRVEAIRSIRSTVRGSLQHDPFGGGLSDFDTQVAADVNDERRMQRALRKAGRKGLDGPLAAALAQSGNLSLVQEFAGLSHAQLRRRERDFQARSREGRQLSNVAVNLAGLRDATRDLAEATRRLDRLEHHLEKGVERGARKGSHDGTAQRERDRNRNAASRTRLGR